MGSKPDIYRYWYTITEKGIDNTDKDRFYLPKSLIDKFDGRTLWLN